MSRHPIPATGRVYERDEPSGRSNSPDTLTRTGALFGAAEELTGGVSECARAVSVGASPLKRRSVRASLAHGRYLARALGVEFRLTVKAFS